MGSPPLPQIRGKVLGGSPKRDFDSRSTYADVELGPKEITSLLIGASDFRARRTSYGTGH